MTEIEWTRSAITDVRSLRDYIARDSEAYADRFVQRIVEAVERVALFPLMGRRVPEAQDDAIREIIFQKYRSMYRIEPTRIVILTVIYGGRDLSLVTPEPWEIL